MAKAIPSDEAFYKKEIGFLLELLVKNKSVGYSGICWGYDFDWEARYTKINAYVPTSVATGIITNSLFESYLIFPNEKIKEIILDAVNFVLKDLNRSYEGDLFCFSYSPVDKQFVLNASLKAARLLSQAYFFNSDPELKKIAKTAVQYVTRVQKENGSWPYAMHDARSWADNYHTGYNLDCIDAYMNLCKDQEFKNEFEKGLQFYITNFFENEEIPKFYDNKIFPIDSTAAAQSLLSLSRFGKLDLAKKVGLWMCNNMQDKNGGFYFRIHKHYKDKTIFMRWNNAWMFAGLSYYLYQNHNKEYENK
ncbi:delta-aminolevulinic acid dehydratase [Aquiflexum gelatinilyticum]|uniref:Delta-aminolevulinic acid dehydratase n=1 Tax=Aquiflexum gelatinilyticum TaxID=2961943 RepID=A0A9X2P2D4_9BACT|nr:delta-aminolevulinic acid dehydratase [Aquiflexum gelatinilyticum]MCR9014619.1 delta-aminolevulinic acid dehydratase [Aquiflexum gelatinilyticum]